MRSLNCSDFISYATLFTQIPLEATAFSLLQLAFLNSISHWFAFCLHKRGQIILFGTSTSLGRCNTGISSGKQSWRLLVLSVLALGKQSGSAARESTPYHVKHNRKQNSTCCEISPNCDARLGCSIRSCRIEGGGTPNLKI